MNKIFLTILATLLVPLSFATAHVKWFVDTEKVISTSHGLTPFYYLTSMEVIVWACISLFVVLAFSVVDRVLPEPKKLFAFAVRHEKGIDRIAEAILGLFLVTASVIWKVIIMPDFPVVDAFTSVLQVIQFIAGLLLIFGIFTRTASLVILFLCVILAVNIGLMELFENLILVSLAIYFLIRHSPRNSFIGSFEKHAIEIVRVGTGIALIIMAFSEKLAYPELGMAFLEVHQWNFMYNMGLTWFSDNLFVLSTGFAEMIFGIVFILGYVTRINTILIASFFACSVVMMAVQFGQWEVEDLVVYSAAILFVLYGHGKTKFFHLMWPKSFLHRNLAKKANKW